MPAQWKLKEVEELKKLISSHQVVGIVGIRGIPAPQMQEMRARLRGKAILRVSKNSLIERALENGTSKLKEFIEGETGIIVSNMNPFKLYKEIEKMRMKAPAKGGEIAPEDIVVKKGDTPFKPGPIVGELQKAGIPAAIREGKVVIEKDVVLVKKGERISYRPEQLLSEKIEPKATRSVIKTGVEIKMTNERPKRSYHVHIQIKNRRPIDEDIY